MVLDVKTLFLDTVDEIIGYDNHRTPQKTPGYQRDPYLRIKWIEEHAQAFSHHLLRWLDVSERANGLYAILDGGGRWLMAQIKGETQIGCRVHHELTRKDEARLFIAFDREHYSLRPVDTFLSALSHGHPVHTAIADAILPYHVGKKDDGALSCVGAFYELHDFFDGRLTTLSRASKIIANTWGGYRNGVWAGPKPEGVDFHAMALVLTNATARFDEAKLRAFLSSPQGGLAKLRTTIRRRTEGTGKIRSAQKARMLAVLIANKVMGIEKNAISTCDLMDALDNRNSGRHITYTYPK